MEILIGNRSSYNNANRAARAEQSKPAAWSKSMKSYLLGEDGGVVASGAIV
jgi:hypothetical protein